MNLSPQWDSDYRVHARQSMVEILKDRMKDRLDRYLEETGRSLSDRRNGHFSRHLLTELGDIELSVPRTRLWSAVEVVRAYARRAGRVDQTILACFVLGLSTRKVAHALMPILGEAVSATTVSRVARILDQAVEAFHRRPLTKSYRFLVFDGVVLKRRTGMGAVKRIVLVALGITREGKKEILDFRIAHAESQAAWEVFLADLFNRGIRGEGTDLIVTDGGKGLLAALPFVYPHIALQRCWAHKTRNILDAVRKKDRDAMKKDLHKISHAQGLRQAQTALKRFSDQWIAIYPKAVASLKADEEELLAFFRIKDSKLWPQIRTTNAIERRFREVKRRTRPMGVFSDRTSMERILYAVFAYENLKEKTWTPFLMDVTQNT
ncbi:MAG: IS256 family transposase [Syntrophaceae bacterium]|nr:IS256 family transposase [Syntrophaceae bacterium]